MVPGTPLVNILQLAVLSRAAPEAPTLHHHRHIVSGVSLEATYSGWSEKKLYPFVGEYRCTSDKIGTIRVEDIPEDNITFYRKSNDSLPKPSYGCGYTAHLNDPVWTLNLQDACKALVKDSQGYYDQRIITGIIAVVPRGFLGVPKGIFYEECYVVA
ncbi:hypothetical protein FOZ63_010010 [Perkinsus olseni]|uniref:Uncharacterized protein n=1 Tax=Perkinsus olseni TaxID=32597 RepID=A0A7J6R921_PEROL|nr:hypothetical protein FOZ63_010010 [Perkinsus olseni]